jgi:hypothetical protein
VVLPRRSGDDRLKLEQVKEEKAKIMSLHVPAYAAIIAFSGVAVQYLIGRLNLKQASAALDVQRTTTARAAATFIAEKRQKWIDDLRADVAQYVALSAELTEAWKRTFSRLGSGMDRFPPQSQSDLDAYDDDLLRFQASIADRDSQHHLLLTRILLRVNHEELAHKGLVTSLSKIRSLLGDIAINGARQVYNIREQYGGIEHELQLAQGYAKAIFYEEWRKLKREVADPERTMNHILATSAPDDAAVKALVEASAASVPSPLSVEHVIPLRMGPTTIVKSTENKPQP